MEILPNLYYTRDHEWLSLEQDEGTIGITDYAQGELGDIVFINLPEAGDTVTQGQPFGTIEAVKTFADLYAPVSGEVSAINTLLEQSPELINRSPYEDGWLIKVKLDDTREVETLLSADDYKKMIASE